MGWLGNLRDLFFNNLLRSIMISHLDPETLILSLNEGSCNTVSGVAEGQTQLSDFTFTFYFHALEKEIATHSSVLAWRISETGEPGGLPSMGSHRVRHD